MKALLIVLTVCVIIYNVIAMSCYFCENFEYCNELVHTTKCHDPRSGCSTIIGVKGVIKRGCVPPARAADPCKDEPVIGPWIQCHYCTGELCNVQMPNSTATTFIRNMPTKSTYLGISGLILLTPLLFFE